MKTDTKMQQESWGTPASTDNKASTPMPPKEKRVRLKTVGDVSHEMAKLYREARNGRIDVSDASKLANMLSILSRILETTDLEKRIEELEQRGVTH